MAAAKAMMKADWKTCADTLLAHKIWGLMPRAEEVSFFSGEIIPNCSYSVTLLTLFLPFYIY